MKPKILLFLLIIPIVLSANIKLQEHPRLLLTHADVQDIKQNLNDAPLFFASYKMVKDEIDDILNLSMDVPMPKDAGGGYTHERHKQNYKEMMNAGALYQISGEEKYAIFVREMLKKYAEMYPGLPLHPVTRSNYRGKIFWQGLNESVWLVYAAQAYDCIYDFLTIEEREYIENRLFYPIAEFLTKDNLSTFNRIHNHGTWAVVAVGMIGYAMGNKDLIDKSLYGFYKNGQGGYLAQINQLFSPDGYFTEGPYYQRYALHPFITFARTIDNNQPELDIFGYKDGVLLKAVASQLQLADSNGLFFYLNDALEKTWHSEELVYALDIAYSKNPDGYKSFLSIAKEQDRVILTGDGMKVARAINNKEDNTFRSRSVLLKDGAKGDEGAVAILRAENEDETIVVFKYTSHGLSHGHFDKLSISFYDQGNNILQDYGAVRFLNIEQKNGGHYLPENDSFAKQTVAHNTIVIDKQSHYNGDINISENFSPKHLFFIQKENMVAAAAEDSTAYPGIKLNRKVAIVEDSNFECPVLIDIFTVSGKSEHTLDLPFYFKGQLIGANFTYKRHLDSQQVFGDENGYQHLWLEAEGKSDLPVSSLTFLNGNRFYSLTTNVTPETELFLTRIGANDPNFNLRNDQMYMLRDHNKSERTYVTILEPHGEFNPIKEYTVSSYPKIKNIEIVDNKRDSSTLILNLTSGGSVKIEIGNRKDSM
ncbi:heparinase II/III domain-containing protein [Proteiniphilum sp. UBA1028]|uniref:heparinase II/III domain-containing protein n=1 Tax=Proteiniphilum sp. UBA1028 TaxID=1947251 RepID=UPI0025F471D4|nr:heparinase II/III family protein [Proteiniphilum sp. UBA1028]